MGGTEHCAVERDGHTLVVTMNRPEARNALSLPMLVGMADAWVQADADDDVRSIVLTGAGGAFCAGMDLKAMNMAAGSVYAERLKADPDLHWKALLRHYSPRKPLIGAVEGYAVAGGTELIQACDIRVAAASATFGLFEVRRGLFPVAGSTVRLPRQIPYSHAMEMLLTGRPYSAAEAREIGLVGHLVDDGKALDKALEIAALINAAAPLSVEAVKRSVKETSGMSEAEGLVKELEIGWPVFATEDAKEGPRAFAEKREALWKRR
jgi:enoyl-CoA hydratase